MGLAGVVLLLAGLLTWLWGPRAPLRVVVVGGGPAGLVSAITARQAGCSVLVLEKRWQYTRRIWFDIQGRPHGEGLDMLRAWGLEQQLGRDELHHFPQFDPATLDLVAVKCSALERLLKAKALDAGVKFEVAEYTGLDSLPEHDVLIGADGSKGRVRADLGIALRPWNISQKSVVLDFLWCPRENTGWDYILLTEHTARTLVVGDQVPWDLVLRVCRVVLDPASLPFSDVDGLRRSTINARIVEESVQRAAVTTKLMPGNRVALLMGDAASSAYYRLGIGVNSALNAQPHLAQMLRELGAAPRRHWAPLVQRKAAADDLRLTRIMRYQAMTMWLHTVCDYVVYFEEPPVQDEYSVRYDQLGYSRPYDRTPTFMVYQYNHDLRVREATPMTVQQAMDRCYQKTGRRREF